MKLHKEGRTIIILAILVFLAINFAIAYVGSSIAMMVGIPVTLILLLLVVQFFRVPKRVITTGDNLVIAPADGKVVVIEEVRETEFIDEQRIQVSIFMSPLNVHVNWYPVNGIVSYFKYHPGKFLVAWHPKSSTENERTTVSVKTETGYEILFRQIAGAVARRIICYAKRDSQAQHGKEMGFIKFGSRVDIMLPLGSEIKVGLNEIVKGSQTVIAVLPTKE